MVSILIPGLSPVALVRLKASGAHLLVNLCIALTLLLLVTRVWYPAPLFRLANGRDIFLLMIACDITLGPVLTLIIFDVRKRKEELIRDVSIIAIVQLAAMFYGLHTLLVARPAYIVYNAGQFNVPLANELIADIGYAPGTGAVAAPWFGPKLEAARLPENAKDRNELIFTSVEGKGDIFQTPSRFVPYDEMRGEVLAHARSVSQIARELHVEPSRVSAAVAQFETSAAVSLLPLVIRDATALALVNAKTGEYLGAVALPPSY